MGIVVVSLGLNAVLWLLSYYAFPRANETTILHYSVDLGVDLVGKGSDIDTLPILGLMLIVVNSLAALMLYRASPISAWVLLGMNPVPQAVLIVAFMLIRQANL